MPNETQCAAPRERRPPDRGNCAPLMPVREAAALGEFIRVEHGLDGVSRFLLLLGGLVPRVFLEQVAVELGVEAPPRAEAHRKEKPPQRDSGFSPDQLMSLMKTFGGGKGGLDPSMLARLIKK